MPALQPREYVDAKFIKISPAREDIFREHVLQGIIVAYHNSPEGTSLNRKHGTVSTKKWRFMRGPNASSHNHGLTLKPNHTLSFYLHNTRFFLNLLSLPSWSPSMRGIWFSRGSLNHGPGGLLLDSGRTKRRLNPIKRHKTTRAHVPNDVNMKCILVRLFALH